jgi:acyl-CoA reductase-like NAD-dependent aldehyde dehydrogenase
MQTELHEKEQDVGHMEHVTKRYIPMDAGGAITRWDLPVILAFGKVLPPLLAGETVVLRLVPINCKPGRYGLARTLFEILSFQPMRMKTQVLVWSLARKASWKPCGHRE